MSQQKQSNLIQTNSLDDYMFVLRSANSGSKPAFNAQYLFGNATSNVYSHNK